MTIYAMGEMRPRRIDASPAWVAPSADLIGNVVLGAGASVWFGAVIRGDNTEILIGEASNVQDGAVLHSDPGFPLTLGREVTIGHRAILHGCTIGDRSLVGMAAVVLNGARISEDTIVGAGALVTEGKCFPPRVLLVGVPAQVRRSLTTAEIDGLRTGAAEYREKAIRYASYPERL
jgi:carbonic anhydrase/acetyltransferase-like protein (isoleucine patch superfamily)